MPSYGRSKYSSVLGTSSFTCVPNFVSQNPPREDIFSELHHSYIILSEFGIATWDVIVATQQQMGL